MTGILESNKLYSNGPKFIHVYHLIIDPAIQSCIECTCIAYTGLHNSLIVVYKGVDTADHSKFGSIYSLQADNL